VIALNGQRSFTNCDGLSLSHQEVRVSLKYRKLNILIVSDLYSVISKYVIHWISEKRAFCLSYPA
jgi:hypothetical protein